MFVTLSHVNYYFVHIISRVPTYIVVKSIGHFFGTRTCCFKLTAVRDGGCQQLAYYALIIDILDESIKT